MKPEARSRRLLGITRSKGKMYEFNLPEEFHIEIPQRTDPRELLVLSIGTLGDAAANLNDEIDGITVDESNQNGEIDFAASFFDAFLQSKVSEEIAPETSLLAASAYYLARRPGSSLVMARRIRPSGTQIATETLLRWILTADWRNYPSLKDQFFGADLEELARLVATHFYDGSGSSEIEVLLKELRDRVYRSGTNRDLLLIDIIAAIARLRLKASSWACLPDFTNLPLSNWVQAIQHPGFPKEMWPSQMLLGKEGIFLGKSGVIQMPTSAGKTRSVEIVLRSAFLSNRTSLAVVVAPFRALSHEIATSLRHAFRQDNIKVNELSDAMQVDIFQELFGVSSASSQNVLVVTPEKLLYILRQQPALINDIGVVVYDEGHQFDSGSRGITYELLLTQIKALLKTDAQTLLISAVIQNADSIGKWLIGEDVRIVDGTALLPTARAVAFASWIERLGQLMFFESDAYVEPDYFVPRVIEQQQLARLPKEKADRFFPLADDSKDVALYLGIRLVSEGAVAIFCGRKDTASSIASRAVDVYRRGFSIPNPSTKADSAEIARLRSLTQLHFGSSSNTTQAAGLGVFVHHGTTPHGLRLSIEYAMQKSLINFVVCTSTLAQGVNLPIRYLVVSSTRQAGEKIKVRDFQNLIGRAGRSGMHTEGLVIFSDPAIFDKRRDEDWRFAESVGLLSPEQAENTASSLLALIAPFTSSGRRKGVLRLSAVELWDVLLQGETYWVTWADAVVRENPRYKFEAKLIVSDLRRRRREIHALESYLMANRGDALFVEFQSSVEQLATSTLAFHLATEELKPEVVSLFSIVASYVEQLQPAPAQQFIYSKTLLGVEQAIYVEQWVTSNRSDLLLLQTNQEWLDKLWDIFVGLNDNKFFHSVQPPDVALTLASLWIQGVSYADLISLAKSLSATKPYGSKEPRPLTDDDIVDFFEHTVSFDCSLIVAAVSQFLFGDDALESEEAQPLSLFHKTLKYGLADAIRISCYEFGFADRMLTNDLCTRLGSMGFSGEKFGDAMEQFPEEIRATLMEYPSYFNAVFSSHS